MQDRIMFWEANKEKTRTYLRGQTEYGDWKLLAVFDETEDIDRWCGKLGANESMFRNWFAEIGLLAA